LEREWVSSDLATEESEACFREFREHRELDTEICEFGHIGVTFRLFTRLTFPDLFSFPRQRGMKQEVTARTVALNGTRRRRKKNLGNPIWKEPLIRDGKGHGNNWNTGLVYYFGLTWWMGHNLPGFFSLCFSFPFFCPRDLFSLLLYM
jgi:hypothetical protein